MDENKIRAKVYAITNTLIDRGLTFEKIDEFWDNCIKEVNGQTKLL